MRNSYLSFAKKGSVKNLSPEKRLAAGNTTTYTWDMDDKMTGLSTSNGSQSASYTYAYNGDRLQRTLNGTAWDYLYSREDILRVSYASGDPMYITQGPGIDDVLAETTGSATNYAYKNMLSSVGAMTDGSSVTQFYRYDAWGQASTWPNPADNPNPYGYTGREWDAQGSYYYRARMYLPEVGRFRSTDKAFDTRKYSYTSNMPISYGDPNGLCPPGYEQVVSASGIIICLSPTCPKSKKGAIVVAASAAATAATQGGSASSGLPSKCLDENPIGGPPLRQTLASGISIRCSLSCTEEAGPHTCAYTYPSGSEITLCVPDAFDDSCGCLHGMILAEMLHLGGRAQDPPGPSPAHDCAKKVFPCHNLGNPSNCCCD